MGERSQTPGLIARKRKFGPDRLYWNADNLSTQSEGLSRSLDPFTRNDATDRGDRDLCETYTDEASRLASSAAAPALAL